MLSFVFKASFSVGLFISGYCLDWIGFISGSEQQTPEAIRNLAIVTFLGMIPVSCLALITILRYPITRDYMNKVKATSYSKE
jgi:Na+/melibiose symporter-like transporter